MIYSIQDTVTQNIKIGYSKNPNKRLSGLQTATPNKLVLLGAFHGGLEHEAELHQKFAQHKLHGEWFKGVILGEVKQILAKNAAGQQQPITNVIVVGDWDFDNQALVYQTLDEQHAKTPIAWLLIGGNRRVERFACQWARQHDVKIQPLYPNWKKHSRGAGSEVGKRMLRSLFDPKKVIAFLTDTVSSTTQAFIRRAKKEGIEVVTKGP